MNYRRDTYNYPSLNNLFPARLLFCIVLTLFLSWPGAAAGAETLTLGLMPYLPKEELMKKFTPLADYLGEKINRKVVIKVAKNYKSHIKYVGQDKIDIAFMGPNPYVELTDNYGQKPILARFETNGKSFFQGYIVIKDDSPLTSLKELSGHRFAFGDPESTMSHLIPHYMLIKAGITMEKLAHSAFVGSHINVAEAVLSDKFDAGAVKGEVYQEYKTKGLKALATTPPITNHNFVTSGKLDPELVESIRNAMYELKNSEEGRNILKGLQKDLTALVPAMDSEYDNLRQINKALKEAGIM